MLVSMAYAIDTSVATEVRHWYLASETSSELTRGMVVMDTFGVMHQEPNAYVVTRASHEKFMSMLVDALR